MKKEESAKQKKTRRERRVDRCTAENTFARQNRSLFGFDTERERLMDGFVYTARDMQEGVGRRISMLRGGTWSDVIDLTGLKSPEERETQRERDIQIDG